MHVHVYKYIHVKTLSLSVQAVLERRWWLVCIKSISVWRATSALQPSILGSAGNALQHTVQYIETHCNTLQHSATLGNTRQHTATLCNPLQHILRVEGQEHSNPLDRWLCW